MRARLRCGPVRVLASCCLLAGCSSVVSGHGGPQTHARARSAPSASAPTSFAQLEALLISSVPAGFAEQPDSVGDTGPSDLAKAIRDEGARDARRVLITDRFVRGYQRLWLNAEHDQIIVFLYQFRTTTGAWAYYRYTRKHDLASAPANAMRFAVPGLPQSQSVGMMARVRHGAVAIAEATTGPFVMLVDCNATSATGLRQRLISVARNQFDRL